MTKLLKCPCCRKETLEVTYAYMAGGMDAWCSNCGFHDFARTED